MTVTHRSASPHTHRPAASRTTGDERRLPIGTLSDKGTGAEDAYDLISSELLLDGSARLNLATFVTTSMPDRARQLMADTADKNIIDKDEYPQTAEIESRCVRIISRLWHALESDTATG